MIFFKTECRFKFFVLDSIYTQTTQYKINIIDRFYTAKLREARVSYGFLGERRDGGVNFETRFELPDPELV